MARSSDGETCNISSEAFFQVVSTGSVAELQELLNGVKPKEKAKIANSYNLEGETPLLLAIKGNHYEMVKFLVEDLKADIFKTGKFNWKGIEYVEALPFFVAVLSDNGTSDQFIINFLVAKSPTDVTAAVSVLKKVFKMSNRTPACRSQLIDMLELMGAAYILHIGELGAIPRGSMGIICWDLALRLRNIQSETSALLKPPTTLSAAAQKVFGQTTEYRNLDELQEIFNSPELIDTRLSIQALLVVERIISRLDPDPHPFFLRCLFQYSVLWFRKANHYRFCVNLVNLILELLHSRQWKDVIDYDWCHKFLTTTLVIINYSVWTNIEEPPNLSQLPFDGFMETINYVTDLVFQLQKHPDPLQKEKSNTFVYFIADSIEMFTEHDKETSPEFQKWLASYIKFTNSHPGVLTVLHTICTRSRSTVPIKIIQLFTNGKADPDAQYGNGNTPLHYLGVSKYFSNVAEATKLLLDVGAHLDQGNKVGVTPLDLFKARKMFLDRNEISDPYIDALTRTVLPLKCLSSQVIRQNSIPYKDQKLPSDVISFVESHSAKCGVKTEVLSQLHFK